MTAKTSEEALENIYISLQNNNEAIDEKIAELKAVLAPDKSVTVDPSRLPQPNREGRKMMQSYFKKRGLIVNFAPKEAG